MAAEVTTGDRYLSENRIDGVDLLKIDAEGSDHLVLQGFAHALAEGRIRVIQFEYGMAAIITHFLLRDFYEMLTSCGYIVGKLYPDGVDFRPYRIDVDEDFLGPNYVAVRESETELIRVLTAARSVPRGILSGRR